MNVIPEKLINFRVYEDGKDLLGVADVELPSIDAKTDVVKGAGIAGEVDSPVIGHFGSMNLKLNWRTLNKPIVHLSEQKAHHLDIRGAVQNFDTSSGEYIVSPVKVVVRCRPKKTGLGKLDASAVMGTSNEFEVIYINISLNGKSVMEIDKYNYVCKVDGQDYLAPVRMALGLN